MSQSIVSGTGSPIGICLIFGIYMIIYGAVKIMGYFAKDAYQLAFQFDLALGIVIAIVGIVFVCRTARNANQKLENVAGNNNLKKAPKWFFTIATPTNWDGKSFEVWDW